MLNLLLCECAKLRRRPLFFLAAAISGLIPLGCALLLPDFRNISDGAEAVEAVMSALFQLSASLLLLPALGVLGSVLFFQEEAKAQAAGRITYCDAFYDGDGNLL